MSRYVTLGAGDYAFTTDMNLLTADAAHNYQARFWNAVTGTVSNPAVAGSFSGKGIGLVGTGSAPRLTSSANTPVSASTEYTMSYSYKVDAQVRAYVYAVYKDVGGGTISEAIVGTPVDPTVPSQEYRIKATFTTPALCTQLEFRLYARDSFAVSAQANGATSTFWDFCLRAGADATFDPSLRIAANDTYTKDPAGITAAFTSGVSLKVGDGWAGDAASVTLQDDVGGPTVAKFSAEDVRAAYPFGNLTTGSTWTDDTGRTWTLTGTGATLGFTSYKHADTVAGPGQLLHTG